jgi:hypothetical protein
MKAHPLWRVDPLLLLVLASWVYTAFYRARRQMAFNEADFATYAGPGTASVTDQRMKPKGRTSTLDVVSQIDFLLLISNVKSVLPNSIRTVRKDHEDHKDRGYFTEGNEGVFDPGLHYRSTMLRLLRSLL